MTRANVSVLVAISLAVIGTSCGNESGESCLPTLKSDRVSPNYEARRFVVQIPYAGSSFEQNVYLLFDTISKHGLIIDPGARSQDLEAVITGSDITIKGILNTHGHFDHTGANEFYRVTYGVDVYAHANDKPFYQRQAVVPTRWITNESDLRLGNLQVHVLITPGHTEGSVCLLAGNHLFSGDTLFRGTIGRTPDRDATIRLVENVRSTLLILPADISVYPGHGELTAIGVERRDNPFLQDDQGR